MENQVEEVASTICMKTRFGYWKKPRFGLTVGSGFEATCGKAGEDEISTVHRKLDGFFLDKGRERATSKG